MRKDTKYIIDIMLSIPKSIYVNLACLPLSQAVKMPIYVHRKTQLHLNRDVIHFAEGVSLHPFMIKFGNKGSEGIIERKKNCIYLAGGNSSVVFNGPAAFGLGSSIRVSGKLNFGKNFCANRNTFISCAEHIVFGDNVLVGWNVSIRDNDGHTVIYDGKRQSTVSSVEIGHNVWICAESHILKGAKIGNQCILAYGSLLTKGTTENNALLAGHPAKIIRQDISWEDIPWDEKK